jgi:flagellar biosynthesis/type III secretory pathway M-ring protein FliF/YscJ
MLTVVLGLTVVAAAVLVIAIITGNTIIALVVVVLAALGLILLARNWLTQRRRPDAESAKAAHHEPAAPEKPVPDPETFQPDVSEGEDIGAEDDYLDGDDSAD